MDEKPIEPGFESIPGEANPDQPKKPHGPSQSQRAWLQRGLDSPDGKLPMFDTEGQQIDPRTVQACLENGWAEPRFANPLDPNVPICRLTEKGRVAAVGRRRAKPKTEL